MKYGMNQDENDNVIGFFYAFKVESVFAVGLLYDLNLLETNLH